MYSKGFRWVEAAERRGEGRGGALPSRLLLGAGEVYVLLGEHRRAEQALIFAQEQASESGDVEVESLSNLGLGRLYRAQGRSLLAAAHLDAALQSSHSGTQISAGESVAWRRQVAVEALEASGLLAQDQGEHALAEQRFQSALCMAGDDGTLAARALLGLASRPSRAGETDEALALLQQARRKARAAGDRILLGRIANNTGIVYYNVRRYDEALEQFREAVEIRQGLGYRTGVVVNYHNIGDTHLQRGDLGRAWAAFQRSRDLAREVGWGAGETMNEVFIAYIEGLPRPDEGPDEDPLARMRDVVNAIGAMSDVELSVSARGLLGRLLLARGEQAEARAVLESALSEAEALGVRPLIRNLREVIAQLEASSSS